MKKLKPYIFVGCFFFLGLLFIVVGATGYSEGPEYGLTFILMGLIICVGLLIYVGYTYYNKRRKQEADRLRQEEFNNYLVKNNFIVTNRIGNFVIDNLSKRWCLNLNNMIYDVAEIESATVLKNASRTWTTSRYSSGNSRRTSVNTTTYGVMIKTKNINCPVVTIPCGYSVSDAEKICATIKIIKKQIKNAE